MFIGGEIARILGGEGDKVLIDSPLHDAVAESGEHHFGEERDKIYLHRGLFRVPLCYKGFGTG